MQLEPVPRDATLRVDEVEEANTRNLDQPSLRSSPQRITRRLVGWSEVGTLCACWVRDLDNDGVARVLRVPENEVPVTVAFDAVPAELEGFARAIFEKRLRRGEAAEGVQFLSSSGLPLTGSRG